jgi:hypothetical protein
MNRPCGYPQQLSQLAGLTRKLEYVYRIAVGYPSGFRPSFVRFWARV